MKNFIDRFAYMCHRPVFFDKFSLALATSEGGGLKPTLNYIERVATLWGFNTAAALGVSPMDKKNGESKIENAVTKFYRAVKNGKRFAPGMNRLMEFRMLKIVFGKRKTPADFEYFRDKTGYYYDIKINIFKSAALWIFEKLMRKMLHSPSPY